MCDRFLLCSCAQPIVTTEHCVAALLEQEAAEPPATILKSPNDPKTVAEDKIQALYTKGNEDALRLQELYYIERRHLAALDQERCGASGD